MNRRRTPLVLTLVLLAGGCTKPDPHNVKLRTGTLAVVAADGMRVGLHGSERLDPVELAPGTMVRIGGDPGEYRETQAQFEAIQEAAPSEMTEADRKSGPRVFPEGHEKARFRSVQVVVESGEHRGLAGSVGRLHLVPAP